MTIVGAPGADGGLAGGAWAWRGDPSAVSFDGDGLRHLVCELHRLLAVVSVNGRVGLALASGPGAEAPGREAAGELLGVLPPCTPDLLGDPAFRRDHRVELAYMAGAMANGIASEELVVAAGRAGLLGSFGAAGLSPQRIAEAVGRIQRDLPGGPVAFNLIHSPSEEALERAAVDIYLQQGVRTIEASAFLQLTPHLVRYRVAGLVETPDGRVEPRNRVIAKVSRREIAELFLSPAPPALLGDLVVAGLVSPQQAQLAANVPIADDITVEADSGGHTDNRPLVVLLPSIQRLRDEIVERHGYDRPPRVGAAGGIGTPQAVAAAFAMGAAYVVTGSVNQSCVEAGTSEHVKRLLADAEFADMAMAPAADMFELGVDVQVLRRGTFFPMRARKLYELYQAHAGIDDIPADERGRLERQIFRKTLDEVWAETRAYFAERDPEQITRADNPKRRMALVFRWYLGLASGWANRGEPGREMDYQVWCGPAMGAFNDWARGGPFEDVGQRRVADVGRALMTEAALLTRLAQLRLHRDASEAAAFSILV